MFSMNSQCVPQLVEDDSLKFVHILVALHEMQITFSLSMLSAELG
jgi:hypothetical protein